VATLAIGRAGAINAALLAASILALTEPAIRARLEAYRTAQTARVLDHPDPRLPPPEAQATAGAASVPRGGSRRSSRR
jgi:hypothetical protein